MRNDIDFELIDFKDKIPEQICEKLFNRGIMSMVVEGGKILLETFIKSRVWDEARIFTGPACFENGLAAPILDGDVVHQHLIGNSKLTIIRPKHE